MKNVPPEKIAELLSYDHTTGLFVRKRYIIGGDRSVKQRLDHDGYLRINVAKTSFKAHRLAWVLYYGKWPDGDIDHINCDRADNRIENLRECSRSQNCHNTSLRRNNKSGVK
ncbi:HNH endonuclease signature motif containing protein, partial [Pseudomonas sp.]|uniref:HNH endonuclease signature motif containing protein n=2 Tax=Pseudomonas TaxID=286 RepID=UPI0029A336DC